MRPLAIDLFCGLGGWTEGLLAEGYYVVGFDIHRHIYGELRYPAQLVLQDVLTLHGSQFRSAALFVASPPCQQYAWRAMPWKAAADSKNRGASATKNAGGSWFRIAHNTTSGHAQNPDGRLIKHIPHMTNPDEHRGIKHQASGRVWFDGGAAAFNSRSNKRKMASAMIAKIPFPLAQYIARTFHPGACQA